MENHTAISEQHEQQLAARLAALPGINLGRNGRLILRTPGQTRDDSAGRVHFEWVCDDGILYNLMASPNAGDEFARTQAFHDEYPDIGIRPVALIRLDQHEVAVFDHFDGCSLEQALTNGMLQAEDAKLLLDRLIDRLEAKSAPAGTEAFIEEIDLLQSQIHACQIWGAMDLRFFDDVIFPYLRTTCESDAWRRRWTTGDFIARNILVDEHAETRLIDCEFACQTVLSAADFQRFDEFSEVPAVVREHVLRRLPGNHRWWRVHFAVDQACKLALVRRPEAFAEHAAGFLQRIWRDLMHDPATPRVSCLFDYLKDLDRLKVHCADLQSRYDELAQHTRNLQSRYDELLAHSNALQGHYEGLEKIANDLQTRAEKAETENQELTGRLHQAQQEKARLDQRLYRIKRPWLWGRLSDVQ